MMDNVFAVTKADITAHQSKLKPNQPTGDATVLYMTKPAANIDMSLINDMQQAETDYLIASVLFGKGGAEDLQLAASLYYSAACAGHPDAQYSLACMYADPYLSVLLGRKPAQGAIDAVHWFTKGAKQGDPRAQLELAGMYVKGCGVDKNYFNACLLAVLVKWSDGVDSYPSGIAKKAHRLEGRMLKWLSVQQRKELYELAQTWEPGVKLPLRAGKLVGAEILAERNRAKFGIIKGDKPDHPSDGGNQPKLTLISCAK